MTRYSSITLCDKNELWSTISARCVKLFKNSRYPFCIALSGGNTPKHIFSALSTENFYNQIDWQKLHFFFTDERYVDPLHPDSNYGMAKKHLFDYIPINKEQQVFPIRTDYADPNQAADYYHKIIQNTVDQSSDNYPQFNLLLLGVGTDGHIASLFPNTTALSVKDKYATAVFVPTLSAWRISLTLPVINNAECIIIFASGIQKAEIIKKIFMSDTNSTLPIHQIDSSKKIEWFLDFEAASLLK